MIINLNEKHVENLKIFLSRVDLKGQEVAAFNELVNALLTPHDASQSNIPKVKDIAQSKEEKPIKK